MATTNDAPVIVLRELRKQFGFGDARVAALDGVDLTIEKGEFVAIMGPSGCGKTTLLNVLGLLDRPTGGDYDLSGRNVAKISESKKAKIRSRQVGFIFQSFNLLPKLTVIENVALPLIYGRGARFRQLEKASKILKTFELEKREYYMPSQLSGGQMQRVAIARALINKPSMILADEPTGNLDSKSSEIIMDELTAIHRKGNTIIMVTHNPELLAYASRVIHMRDGRIARDTELTMTKAYKATEKFVSERKKDRAKKQKKRKGWRRK